MIESYSVFLKVTAVTARSAFLPALPGLSSAPVLLGLKCSGLDLADGCVRYGEA